MISGDIAIALSEAGIKSGDVLMIHGDAIVGAQIKSYGSDSGLHVLLDEILKYLGDHGTLIIPSFTYSFTKSEVFDLDHTKSDVGHFSEFFRFMPGVVRSSNPLFSVCAIGKHKSQFQNSSIFDSFGSDSCFGVLERLNGRVMCLGCDFDTTFIHYVEQMNAVPYRYFKNFRGVIVKDSEFREITTSYYVGDLSVKYRTNLKCLKEYLIDLNKLVIVPFGRFASYTVSCKDLVEGCSTLLAKDGYALIEEGVHERR